MRNQSETRIDIERNNLAETKLDYLIPVSVLPRELTVLSFQLMFNLEQMIEFASNDENDKAAYGILFAYLNTVHGIKANGDPESNFLMLKEFHNKYNDNVNNTAEYFLLYPYKLCLLIDYNKHKNVCSTTSEDRIEGFKHKDYHLFFSISPLKYSPEEISFKIYLLMLQEKYQTAKMLIDEHSEELINNDELSTCCDNIEDEPLYCGIISIVIMLLCLGGVVAIQVYLKKKPDELPKEIFTLLICCLFALALFNCIYIACCVSKKNLYDSLKIDCDQSEARFKALSNLEIILDDLGIEEPRDDSFHQLASTPNNLF